MKYTEEEILGMNPTQLKSAGKELGVTKKPTQTWRDYAIALTDSLKGEKSLLENEAPVIVSQSDSLEKPAQDFVLKVTNPDFYKNNGIPFCDVCCNIIAHDLRGRKVCKRTDCPN